MPVPSLVTDLSTTISSNSPAGGDAVFPDLDNYLRALSGFVASIYANSGNGWVSPYLPLTGGTMTGTLNGTAGSFSSTLVATAFIPSGATIPANGLYLPGADNPGIASNATLRWSVNSTGNHVFVAPSTGIGLQAFGISGERSLSAGSAIATNNPRWEMWHTEGTGLSDLRFTGSTGTYAGRISRGTTAMINFTSGGNVTVAAPDSGDALSITPVSGGRGLNITGSLSGAQSISRIENTSNTASSDAIDLLVVAGTSAGDPFTRYSVTGATDVSIGIDNSDSDTFKISFSTTLGSGQTLGYTSAGALSGIVDLTTSGNTILGNALGDTLSVGSDALKVHSDGRVSGNKLHNIGTVTGTTDQFIASGTYTPTITNVSNIDSTTARAFQWIRVGNVVTVSGAVNIDPTSAASTNIGISLPIASNLASAGQAGGNGACTTVPAQSGPVFEDTGNDRVQYAFTATNTSAIDHAIHFTYLIA